jgi:flagellar biosynthesis protein FlhA
LLTDRLLAINPGTVTTPVDGTPTRERRSGCPLSGFSQDKRDQAIAAGYTVVDPTTAISTICRKSSARSCRIC